MFVLLLVTSLSSQFHHDLDVKHLGEYYSKKTCLEVAEEVISDLKHYSPEIKVEVICKSNL